MFRNVLLIIANILLVLLPFSPILDNFAPHHNGNLFSLYLQAFIIFSIVLILLAVFIYCKSNMVSNGPPKLFLAGWLLFGLAVWIAAPLHMGAPAMDETLLNTTNEEQFRFVMLLIAVAFFLFGTVATLNPLWHRMAFIERVIIIPILVASLVLFWDYYDSYQFGTKMAVWVNSGKDAKDFFPNYNFHETWRALGRILLYVNAAWLCFILLKQMVIKKWVAISLLIFCAIGIAFCFVFLSKGMEFYFPFMVPGIALAPAYWIGIALLNRQYKDHI